MGALTGDGSPGVIIRGDVGTPPVLLQHLGVLVGREIGVQGLQFWGMVNGLG